MDEEITDRIIKYMLHDTIGNVEGEIAEFDTDKLQEAENQGAVFVAVYNSGRREIVKAVEVVEPEPILNGTVLVTPAYVDERARATVAVFDALAAVISPVSAASVMSDEQQEPPRSFSDALEALRLLAYPNKDGGR